MFYTNGPGQPAAALRRKVARYLDDRGIHYTLSEQEAVDGFSRLSSREPRLGLAMPGPDVLIDMWDVLDRDGSRYVTFWTMTYHGGRDVGPFAQGRSCVQGQHALAEALADLIASASASANSAGEV